MIYSGTAIQQSFVDGTWKAYRGKDTCLAASDLHINPNSIDVTLGQTVLRDLRNDIVDPWDESAHDWAAFPTPYPLEPGEMILGYVNERFDCDTAVPLLEGRSTVARCGIAVHITAGFGDIGFKGAFTLEILNLSRRPFLLRPNMRIAQVYFVHPTGGTIRRYDSAYSGENHFDRPVPPKLGKDRF